MSAEKDDFLKKLEKLVEHAKTKHNTLDAGEINNSFAGGDLSPEQTDQIYSYLKDRSIGVVPVLDETMLTEDTVLLDNIDLDLNLDDDGLIKDAEEKEIDLDAVDLLEGIGTEDPIHMYLREIGTMPLLTANEELDLVQRRAGDDEFVKGRLIEASLCLVVSIAERYTGRGMSFLGLIQEGNLGPTKGVERFSYTKGYKLSTYATWWIHRFVTKASADQVRTIRVLVHMVGIISKMSKMQKKLMLELGHEPFVIELAEAFDMAENKVMEIIQIVREPAFLETPIGEEDNSDLGDFAANNNVVTPEGNAESMILWGHIDVLLGDPKERGHQAIIPRLGLEDDHLRTLEEVDKELNVIRERIRRIEAKTLRKLRNLVGNKWIRDLL